MLGIPAGTATVEAAPVPAGFPDTDHQTLYVKYPSLYEPVPYIADEVKVEVSVRSLNILFTERPIQSLVNEFFPDPVYGEAPFSVAVVEPRKTFLEKAFLLHEEFLKPDRARIRAERMSRHPYDLISMMKAGIMQETLDDHELYDHIIKDRQWYTGFAWVNHQSLDRSTISFIPPDDLLDTYRKDYETMREQMIYGEPMDSMDFKDLIGQLRILQDQFRATRN